MVELATSPAIVRSMLNLHHVRMLVRRETDGQGAIVIALRSWSRFIPELKVFLLSPTSFCLLSKMLQLFV